MVAINQQADIPIKPQKRQSARRRRPGQWDIPIATALVFFALSYTWSQRDQHILTAETGVGYWLGIVGASLMLLLLLYPLRKRIRFMNRFGAVPGWFRIHMVFGVIGPGLVLLHTNFQLGSLNSQMALFSMLIVAGSGYIGRFLYYRIQIGLSSRKQMVVSIRDTAYARWTEAGVNVPQLESSLAILKDFEKRALGGTTSSLTAIVRAMGAGRARRKLKRQLMRQPDIASSAEFGQVVDEYVLGAKQVQKFILYERLFALWHLLHLPLFFILLGAAILHVVAVHLF